MNRRFRLHNPPMLETKKRSRVSLPCAVRQDPSRGCVGARVRQVPREQRWPLSGARLRTEPGKRSQDRAKAWRPISNRTDDYPDSLCSIHRISSSQSAAALALDPLPMYHFVWKTTYSRAGSQVSPVCLTGFPGASSHYHVVPASRG
jgi:hypothetical protein